MSGQHTQEVQQKCWQLQELVQHYQYDIRNNQIKLKENSSWCQTGWGALIILCFITGCSLGTCHPKQNSQSTSTDIRQAMHLALFPFLPPPLPFLMVLFPAAGSPSPLPSSSLLVVALERLVLVASELDWPRFRPCLGGEVTPACKERSSLALIMVKTKITRSKSEMGWQEQSGRGRKMWEKRASS